LTSVPSRARVAAMDSPFSRPSMTRGSILKVPGSSRSNASRRRDDAF
jgi:hypothetical protein